MLVLGVQALIRVFVLSGGQLRGVIQRLPSAVPGNRPQDGRAVSESARLSAKQSGHFSLPSITSAAGVHPCVACLPPQRGFTGFWGVLSHKSEFYAMKIYPNLVSRFPFFMTVFIRCHTTLILFAFF